MSSINKKRIYEKKKQKRIKQVKLYKTILTGFSVVVLAGATITTASLWGKDTPASATSTVAKAAASESAPSRGQTESRSGNDNQKQSDASDSEFKTTQKTSRKESEQETEKKTSKETETKTSKETETKTSKETETKTTKEESTSLESSDKVSQKESEETSTTSEGTDVYTEETTTKGTVSEDPEQLFANTVFIGDSRSEGLYLYSQASQYGAAFLVHKGLTLTDYGTDKMFGDSGNQTVYEFLQGKKYDRVFLGQGLNELGWNTVEEFQTAYSDAIEEIHSILPDATIYVQEIIQVSQAKSAESPYFTKDRCDQWNVVAKALCDKPYVKWIPLNQGLTGSDGYLFADAGSDGIHLNKQYCQIWLQEIIDFLNQ